MVFMKALHFPCLHFWALHCVKSVRIRSYSGPYFPTFGVNTERYEVSVRIQSEREKMWIRITPNTDTFHTVLPIHLFSKWENIFFKLFWKFSNDFGNPVNVNFAPRFLLWAWFNKDLIFLRIYLTVRVISLLYRTFYSLHLMCDV